MQQVCCSGHCKNAHYSYDRLLRPAPTVCCQCLLLRHLQVYGTLVPVVLGVVIASGFEPSFNVVGFSACIAATVMRALKTVLSGVL